jgi:hypothetical protein
MSSNSRTGVASLLLRTALLTAALLALAGCRHAAWERAEGARTVEAYRAFLAQHPESPQAEVARDRLAELEFERAAQLHTVLAYKRYLDEFAESTRAAAARARLEGLRFNAAKAKDTDAAYRQFLEDHPDGTHRDEAAARLAELELKNVAGSDDASRLKRLVAQYPHDPRRAEAEGRLDQLAFERALKEGAAALRRYLQDHPAGEHREAAQARLLEIRLEGLLVSGMIAEARAEARSPLAARLPQLAQRFQRAEEERALKARPEPLVQSALAGHYLRDLPDLLAALGAPDPLDRWQAAEELGHQVSVAGIDSLLDAVRGSRHLLVRWRAFEALGTVLRALPSEVAEAEVAGRVEALRVNASDAAVFLAIAVLLDLSGQREAAAAEYARAYEPDQPDPIILFRWAWLRRERGQPFAAATMARQLALWAQSEVDDPGDAPIPAARQLCSAAEAARFAAKVIEEARARPSEFPKDLDDFSLRATDAVRLAEARLKDAEVVLKTREPLARTCDDARVTSRLREGEQERMEALRALPGKLPALAPKVLRLVAERDPAPAVRAEAVRLLGSAVKKP